MYQFVDNNFYQDVKLELKKHQIKPILLYYISLSDKKTSKQNFTKLKLYIEKLPKELEKLPKAVQIKLEKEDNNSRQIIEDLNDLFNITIGLGGLNKVNRFFLEKTKIDFLQDPQNSFFKPKIDFIHHFNTGTNHILFNFARQKEIGLFISNYFIYSSNQIKTKEIGRISQNIKFSNKLKVISIYSPIIKSKSDIKTKIEIKNTLKLLSATPNQIKENQINLDSKLKEKEYKKSKNYISKGIILK